MRIKTLVCAAMLATAAVASHAENLSPTVPLVANDALPGSFSAAFGATHELSGAFTDTISFTGATSGLVSASLVTIGFLPQANINLSSVTLNGMPLVISGGGMGVEVASLPMSLFSGPLTLVVTGTAAPTLGTGTAIAASYAGTVNVSAVPEPESYALLLAGLGVVGLLSRRRFMG